MIDFIATLFNAITEGATYALIAVGYTMVYGIVRLINFAHGEVYMVGAVGAWFLFTTALQVPLWLALPLSMVLCAALGLLLDRVAYRPLRRSPRLTALITAIGVSLVLQTTVQLVHSPKPESFPEVARGKARRDVDALEAPRAGAKVAARIGVGSDPPLAPAEDGDPPRGEWLPVLWTAASGTARVWLPAADVELHQGLPPRLNESVLPSGELKLPLKDVLIWAAAAAAMTGLYLVVQRTRLGRAMRACATDPTTAALMGVDVDRVIAATFMIGSAMAALAGVLYAVRVGGNISFRMGYYPGVIAFAAAVLGGIGDLRGALLGGLLLGVARAFWARYTSSPEYDFAFCFSLMIGVIIVRPYGLLGKPSSVRA